MKLPYENELYELRKWIDFTNANLQMQFLHTPQEIQRVHQWINAITRGIQADYPFYAATLPCVANILFQQNEMGAIFLNPAAFGELVVIVRHIEAEPVVVQFWSAIHPRIPHDLLGLPPDLDGKLHSLRLLPLPSELGKGGGKAVNDKSTDVSRWICYYIKGYSPYSGTGDNRYSHRMRQSGPGAWPGARRRGGRASPGRNRPPAPGPGAQRPAGSSGSRSKPGGPPL